MQCNRKHTECKHKVTEDKYCLFHDSCTRGRQVFYSPWNYVITVSVFVLVTAIRKQISVLSAICCLYRTFVCSNCHRSVPRIQFTSVNAGLSVRDYACCCSRCPCIQNTCKYSERFYKIAELLLKSTENMYISVGRGIFKLRYW